jgi:hypothetical protein
VVGGDRHAFTKGLYFRAVGGASEKEKWDGGSFPWIEAGQFAAAEVARSGSGKPLPLVLSADAVRAVLGRMKGTPRVMAELMYGSGLDGKIFLRRA